MQVGLPQRREVSERPPWTMVSVCFEEPPDELFPTHLKILRYSGPVFLFGFRPASISAIIVSTSDAGKLSEGETRQRIAIGLPADGSCERFLNRAASARPLWSGARRLLQ